MKLRSYILLFVSVFFLNVPFLLAQEGVRFEIYPVNPNTTSPSWFLYSLKPGDSTTDHVVIKNKSLTPQTFEVYAVDRQEPNPQDIPDSFILSSKGEGNAHIGKWITFGNTTVTLSPEEEAKIPFTLRIPEDAQKKEYAGGIVGRAVLPPPSPDPSKEGTVSLNVVASVAIRVYTTVTDSPNEIPRKFAVADLAAQERQELTSQEQNNSDIFTPLNIILGLVFFIILLYVLKTLVFKKAPKL